ncbi:Hypothetical predicted protein [Lecanosticta acicola]|uniref:Conidiation-specific protein 8 n=1 Tax=Lecanosticta acicola TaxID=111012 RepID=A0AAI8W1J3_9PEZI|nr:Hypothetical predicted protein [Lecanosticta acicola]
MSQSWEDRRGLFQRGKEIHEPGRKLSGSAGAGGVMDAVRRASTSSGNSGNLVDKPLSNDPGSPTSPTSQRRRSSTASGGLFSNLQHHKRGSEDYANRRASQTEALGTGNGLVSGWWNSTFRGIKKPNNLPEAADSKKGVME